MKPVKQEHTETDLLAYEITHLTKLNDRILNLSQLRSSKWVQCFWTTYTYPKTQGDELLDATIENRKLLNAAGTQKTKKGGGKKGGSTAGGVGSSTLGKRQE